MELSIVKPGNAESGTVSVSDVAFAREYNEDLVHQVVTAYLAGARQGTRAQKNRSAVRGGGAKPWRQKGTGRARAGTIRSPLFTGGGRIFPATTQDFSQKVNRKMYRSAMRSILSELNRQERLVVVDGFAMEEPKTRALLDTLGKLEATQALIVTAEDDRNVELSARNVSSVSVCNSRDIDPVSLIRHDKVVITAEAAKNIDEALQ